MTDFFAPPPPRKKRRHLFSAHCTPRVKKLFKTRHDDTDKVKYSLFWGALLPRSARDIQSEMLVPVTWKQHLTLFRDLRTSCLLRWFFIPSTIYGGVESK